MNRYRKKQQKPVSAVQLNLVTEGLRYEKWGDEQFAKAGDWLVNNAGSVYTVDQNVFARTYDKISLGVYQKTAIICAEQATQDGSIKTLEGRTHYITGDYLVYEEHNQTEGAYAISQDTFEEMYEKVVD